MEVKMTTYEMENGFVTEGQDIFEFTGWGETWEESRKNFKDLLKKYYSKKGA